LTRHILPNISPSFPSGPEALWAGGQRGEFLLFIKGGKEGFGLRCLYNYGLINNRIKGPRSKFCLTLCPQPIWSIGHQRIKKLNTGDRLMKKVLISYFSRTGKTQQMAEYIAEGIRISGHEAELRKISDIKSGPFWVWSG